MQFIPPQKQFASLWYSWRKSASSLRFNPVLPLKVPELEQRLELVSSDLSKWRTHTEFMWFLSVKDQVVGTITLKNINLTMGHAEIGYTIAEEQQGQGYASLAVAMLLEKVFIQTEFYRLQAFVAVLNTPSRRVLLKNAFTEEGILRHLFIINEQRVDEVLYAILRPDWEKQQKK